MTEPASLRDAASSAVPERCRGEVGTVLGAHEGAALWALSAYFGADDEREVARVVVGSENLGYVERGQALALLDVQSRELGHAIGWTLPGISNYALIELRCRVDGCNANPIFAADFDDTYPPHCPLHSKEVLTLVKG